MLMPKVKYREQQPRSHGWKGLARFLACVRHFGLKVMECGWITDQIRLKRLAWLTRSIKRGGKVWVDCFRTNPSPNPLKLVWVKVKARRISG